MLRGRRAYWTVLISLSPGHERIPGFYGFNAIIENMRLYEYYMLYFYHFKSFSLERFYY